MRWTHHPGRTLMIALLLAMSVAAPAFVAAAQTDGTPVAGTPSEEAPQSIWQTLDGVEGAIVRTWSDVPPPGTPTPEGSDLRFITGLVVQFDGEESAGESLDGLRDWVIASLQVNLVDVDLTQQIGQVSNLGDAATAVNATGTTGENPLTITVIVAQDGDRLLAVGGSIMSDEELLPVVQGIVTVMLDRELGEDDVEVSETGRFTGGNWSIFPEQDDPSLDDMQRQGDLPLYDLATPTPAG
ncbi:MAG: hypothetical protein H0V98_02285, partial [Chloroflexia bacterium]|nr:hypothetical protein [Chloroflexia bacterium]